MGRSAWQMVHTLIPYFGIWTYLAFNLSGPLWITIPLIFLGAGFLVRAFIIFHDCGHNSFFKSRRANEIVGTLIGLLAFTPFHHWRWEHAQHHSTVGDLDNRGIGDLWTMTIEEYLESPLIKRIGYRIVRSPWFLFGFVPLFLFLVKQRFPAPQAKAYERKTLHLTSVAVVLLSCVVAYLVGWKEFLIVQTSILTLAASAGSWLFYIQHQYEDTYWERSESWDYFTASMLGSSYYKLPKVLQFFSGNIGFHHIHHLNSKIPNYHLEECQTKFSFLQEVKPIGLMAGMKTAHLALWDEEQKKMVTFKGARLSLRMKHLNQVA